MEPDRDSADNVQRIAARLRDCSRTDSHLLREIPLAFCEVMGRTADLNDDYDVALCNAVLRVLVPDGPPWDGCVQGSAAGQKAGTGMTLPTGTERRAIALVTLVLSEFRKVHPEIGTQQCITLLAIAEEPGLTVTDLSRKTGIGLASMSRHIETLGPHRPSKNVGWGLVADDTHPTDRRRKVITLTREGWDIVRNISRLVSD